MARHRILLTALSIASVVAIAQQLIPTSKPSMPDTASIEISCQQNYADTSVSFRVPQTSMYRVVCSAELILLDTATTQRSDAFRVYFDVNNEKLKSFDSKKDDRAFKIIPRADTTKFKYAIKQMAPHLCYFEVFIPWETLGKKPSPNQMMGFDASFTDNDGYGSETELAWHANDSEMAINTNLYGNIKFVNTSTSPSAVNDAILLSVYEAVPPRIDGQKDALWQSAPVQKLQKITFGRFNAPQDCRAMVQTLWNDAGVYLLATVIDDNVQIKNTPLFSWGDHGWISDSLGNWIWGINNERAAKAQLAGGTLKNRVINELITLQPGAYTLHYVSDESHAPGHWDDAPPSTTFYGIKLTKQK